MPRISPYLWFDTEAEQAAQFYTSIFPNSKITEVTRNPEGAPGPEGSVLVVSFTLDGQRVSALNGGPHFRFTEAISLLIECADQTEVDHYWDALTADGGQPSQCGWLKDKYGLSWQVVPTGLLEAVADPDPGRASRAVQAMLGMHKIDLAAIRAAADGVG